MTDHPMTRYIRIGDVELRLDMIARALGIPALALTAATLRALAQQGESK